MNEPFHHVDVVDPAAPHRTYPLSYAERMPGRKAWLGLLRAIEVPATTPSSGEGCSVSLTSHVHCPGPPAHTKIVSTCCDGLTEEECVEQHARAVADACA